MSYRTKDKQKALQYWPPQKINGYIKDRTGQKKNRCIAQWFTRRVNKNTYWVYLCDCGNYFEASAYSIAKGTIKSCGCLRKEVAKEYCTKLGAQHGAINGKVCIKDYTGQKFGELTFIKQTDKRRSGNIIWKLQHDNGKIYYATSWEVLNGEVTGSNFSFGELKTQTSLEELNINYYSQYSFKDCKDELPLRFDFYLPDNNCCIECDGIQHFQPVEKFGGEDRFIKYQYHDKIKTQYCKDNNIKLIRIPYTNYKQITPKYLERLITNE